MRLLAQGDACGRCGPYAQSDARLSVKTPRLWTPDVFVVTRGEVRTVGMGEACYSPRAVAI